MREDSPQQGILWKRKISDWVHIILEVSNPLMHTAWICWESADSLVLEWLFDNQKGDGINIIGDDQYATCSLTVGASSQHGHYMIDGCLFHT